MQSFSYGVVLTLNLNNDITGYTDVKIKIEDPRGTKKTVDASVVNSLEGIVQYTSEINNFRLPGDYRIQAFVTFSPTKRILSEVGHIHVEESL